MAKVDVHFWVEDHSDVVTYTVSVSGGIGNADAAIDRAREKAEDDGYTDVDLRELDWH